MGVLGWGGWRGVGGGWQEDKEVAPLPLGTPPLSAPPVPPPPPLRPSPTLCPPRSTLWGVGLTAGPKGFRGTSTPCSPFNPKSPQNPPRSTLWSVGLTAGPSGPYAAGAAPGGGGGPAWDGGGPQLLPETAELALLRCVKKAWG